MLIKRKFLFNSFKLISSGLLTSIFVLLISSNRVFNFQGGFAIKLLLIIQWETLGLTFSKLGFDTYLFAQFKANPNKVIDFIFTFKRVIVPIIIFSIGSICVYDWHICLLLLLSILFDVFSTILIAYFNAKEQFNVTVFANLFNYPFFFILLLFLNLYLNYQSLTAYIAVFSLSSLARLSFLIYRYNTHHKISVPTLQENESISKSYLLGLQQLSNYYLFRSDQIILNLASQFSILAFVTEGAKLNMLFYIKISELLNGLIVVLSPLYLDKFYSLKDKINKYIIPYIIFGLIGLATYFYAAHFLWKFDTTLKSTFAIPYIFYCILILPVNQIIYYMMRKSYIKELVNVQIISILIGLIPIALMLVFNSLWLLISISFIHLLLFVTFFKLKVYGKK